jgi:hypothetical protein
MTGQETNLFVTFRIWNSLFFWVDIQSNHLFCYDMEHNATVKSELNRDFSLRVSDAFIFGTEDDTSFSPQLTFNNNRLYY